jgi:hypothetical protein
MPIVVTASDASEDSADRFLRACACQGEAQGHGCAGCGRARHVRRGAGEWGSAQNLGVSSVPTTSVRANLPILARTARCDHGLSPANHVSPYQPPPSGCRGATKWRSPQNLGVSSLPTTSARPNLPFLAAAVPESGGRHRIWGLAACQPRPRVPTSPFWLPRCHKVGVATESGG